jgi:hypothetical protein
MNFESFGKHGTLEVRSGFVPQSGAKASLWARFWRDAIDVCVKRILPGLSTESTVSQLREKCRNIITNWKTIMENSQEAFLSKPEKMPEWKTRLNAIAERNMAAMACLESASDRIAAQGSYLRYNMERVGYNMSLPLQCNTMPNSDYGRGFMENALAYHSAIYPRMQEMYSIAREYAAAATALGSR